MRRTIFSLCILTAAALATSSAAGEYGDAPGQKHYASVRIRVIAPEAGAGPAVEVTLIPEAGVKLYREKTGIGLDPALTSGGLRAGPFALPPGEVKPDEATGKMQELYLGPVTVRIPLIVPELQGQDAGQRQLGIAVSYLGCQGQVCFMPQSQTVVVTMDVPAGSAVPPAADSPSAGGAVTEPGREAQPPTSADAGEAQPGSAAAAGGLMAVLLAFLAGLGVSFTPCVYPMIPITVALIGGAAAGREGAKRRAVLLPYTLVYVLGISLTYTLLGVLAASAGNVMKDIMQTWWLPAIVAAVMGLLAMSMFGAFELQLPAALTARLGRFQGAGSLPMLLFSGIVLGLVASPCVSGPIAAMLTAIGASGSVVLGGATMFAFAWGMSVLLIAAGLFPGLLVRPGMWMNRVKTAFGTVMALAGLYFLRTVLPLWLFTVAGTLSALGLGLALLLAARRLAGNGAARRWTAAGGSVALAVFAYLAFGTAVRFGALEALVQSTLPVGVASGPAKRAARVEWGAYGEDALAAARASGRPALVKFYADWCGNCVAMERTVFADPRVAAELDRFARLKVDASTGVPKEPVRDAERRFAIVGYPTMILFGADGREAIRIVGAVSADGLLEKLRAVR